MSKKSFTGLVALWQPSAEVHVKCRNDAVRDVRPAGDKVRFQVPPGVLLLVFHL